MQSHFFRKSPAVLGFIVLLFSSLFVSETLAASAETVSLAPDQPQIQLLLNGKRFRTLYRTEQYEGTCYRDEEYMDTCLTDEAYTDYETRCSPRYERQCSTDAPICIPSCRDVMRPVCDSSGCKDFSTRECTESCVGGGQSCDDVRVGESCENVPVTRYRSVEYSCTKTRSVPYSCTKERQVPNGKELVEDRQTKVTILLQGDTSSLTKKDLLKIETPDGVDVGDFDAELSLAHSANTHLLYVTKTGSAHRAIDATRTEYSVSYAVKALDQRKVAVAESKIESLASSDRTISFALSGGKVDESTKFLITIEKNQLIGPWKKVAEMKLDAGDFKLSPAAGGKTKMEIELSKLFYEYNKRPHRVTVQVNRDLRGGLAKDLLNPEIFETMKLQSSDSATIEGKFGKN